MTDLLLDTHVVLWWLDDRPLSSASRDAVAAPEHEAYVSVASLWELAIKHSVGRFRLDGDLPGALVAEGFRLLPIEVTHVLAVRDLPLHHKDPFDRMLVAQARVEGLTLVTRDQRLESYEVEVLPA